MESSKGTYKTTIQITNGDVISIMYNTLRKTCFEFKVQNKRRLKLRRSSN